MAKEDQSIKGVILCVHVFLPGNKFLAQQREKVNMQYMVNIFFSLQIGRQGYQKAVKLH
jgi:hypothetical protein